MGWTYEPPANPKPPAVTATPTPPPVPVVVPAPVPAFTPGPPAACVATLSAPRAIARRMLLRRGLRAVVTCGGGRLELRAGARTLVTRSVPSARSTVVVLRLERLPHGPLTLRFKTRTVRIAVKG